ncbi:MAG: acyltransferase [Fimbriimonas sp.]|nr:acyltransferase [Fimbriimonas sp.]
MPPKAKTKAPQNRLPFLEGIRGLAALYVVIGHLCTLSDPRLNAGRISHSPLWLQRVMGAFSYGHIAVAAFIVLSGFCLELSLFAREDGVVASVKRFYTRRAQRILPPYYACLAISVFVALTITTKQFGIPFEQYLPVDRDTILAHVFLVHNLSLDWMYKINGVLWSIAIEVQLYILFPLISLGINKVGRLLTLLLAAGITYETILRVPGAPKLYPWYLALFTAGAISAHLAFKPNRLGRQPFVGSLFSLVCVAGIWYAANQDWPIYATDLFAGCAVAGICYAHTGAARGPLYRFLVWRPIVVLGTFSYSLYLMHHPIAQILYANRPSWAVGEVNLFLYFLYCLPAIVFGCWLFYLFFERPFVPKKSPQKPPVPKRHAPAALPLRPYTSNAP